jgi:hypothetical protein
MVMKAMVENRSSRRSVLLGWTGLLATLYGIASPVTRSQIFLSILTVSADPEVFVV